MLRGAEHGHGLSPGNRRRLAKELVERVPSLEVIEQRCDRYSRAANTATPQARSSDLVYQCFGHVCHLFKNELSLRRGSA